VERGLDHGTQLMPVVGDATVLVHMDTSGAATELKSGVERELDSAGGDLEAAGAQAGGRITKGVEEETDKIPAKAEAAGKNVGDKLAGGLESGTGKIAGIMQNAGVPVGNFGGVLGKLTGAMGGVAEKSGLVSGGLATVSGVGLATVGAAGAVAVGAMVKLAMSMQSADAQLAATGGVSTKTATDIGNAFLGMGGKTIYTGQEMVQALTPVSGVLKDLAGGHLNAATAMGVMTNAADIAEGTNIGLNSATSVLVQTLKGFQLSTKDAGLASDVLVGTAQHLGVGVEAVSTSLTRVHSAMGSLTPSIGDLSAFMVDLSQHGESGRRAVTAASQAMTLFQGAIDPTTKSQKALSDALAQHNIHLVTNRDGTLNLAATIGAFTPLLAGHTKAQDTAILSSLGFGKAAQTITDTLRAGEGAFDKAYAHVTKVGQAHEAAAKAGQTLGHQFELIKTAVIDQLTLWGERLMPIIMKVAEVFLKAGSFIMQHKEILIALGAVIAAIVLPALIGLVGTLYAMAAAAIAAAAPFLPITLAIGAVIVIALLLKDHWKAVWDAVKTAVEDAWHFIDGVFHDIEHIVDEVINFIKSHWELIVGIITGPIGLAIVMIVTHFNEIKTAILKVVDDVVGFFTALPGRIATAISTIFTTGFALFMQAATWINTNVIQPIINWFMQLPTLVANAIVDFFTKGFALLMTAAAWVGTNVTWPIIHLFEALPGEVAKAIGDFFTTAFGAMLAAGQWVYDHVVAPVVAFIGTIPDLAAKGLGDIMGGIFGGLGDVGKWIDDHLISPVVNAIKDIPNKIGNIGKDILDKIGSAFTGPAHAAWNAVFGQQGGIIDRPMLVFAGEAGPEALLPLNDMERSKQILGAQPLGGQLGTRPMTTMATATTGGATVAVTVSPGAVVINPPPGADPHAITSSITDGFNALANEILAGVAPVRSPL
jgi:TP901 family phage tail tape measure protein